MSTDPNIQSLVAFGIVAVLVGLGLVVKIMIGRSKRTERRADIVDF